MQYTCNVSLNREKILNSHKIFDFQNLTKLYVTYTICASNIPILFCWHQFQLPWATTQYQCDHFLQLQRVECSSKCRKENHWKSTVLNKANFSSVMTNLWRFGWVCFWDDYIRLNFFKRKVRSSNTLVKQFSGSFNSFSWLEVVLRMKQHNDIPHYWHGFCLCKVPSSLTTSFKPLKMVLSSCPIEISEIMGI